jgi:hypothetical protein
MYSAIVRLLALGSMLTCMIVIASFSLFAVRRAEGASAQQQAVLASGSPVAGAPGPASGAAPVPHAGGVRSAIDDASAFLTSPFDGLTSHSHSEWTTRIGGLLLALALYGFGLGFLSRTLRVHV